MVVRKSVLFAAVLALVVLGGYTLIDQRVIFADRQTAERDMLLRLQSNYRLSGIPTGQPAGRDWQPFEATAYCTSGITASGVWVQRGILAVDPQVIPIGSIVELRAGAYSGLYTAMDTGSAIRDRLVDIYMPSWEEAVQFGRQRIHLRVIRPGWNPVVQPVTPRPDAVHLVN